MPSRFTIVGVSLSDHFAQSGRVEFVPSSDYFRERANPLTLVVGGEDFEFLAERIGKQVVLEFKDAPVYNYVENPHSVEAK